MTCTEEYQERYPQRHVYSVKDKEQEEQKRNIP